jgi:hypothetical protein
MPDRIDQREAIGTALRQFDTAPLPEAARRFFATLGHRSERCVPLRPANAAGLVAAFDQ